MRRTAFQLLVISSAALLLSVAVYGRTRPRYGDTLRVETRASVSEYEGAPDLLTGLVFETLVTTDGGGRPAPGLASYWSSPNNGYRWEFLLRNGVQFHDGTTATPIIVAQSLAQVAIPGCKVLTASNGVVVDCESTQPSLPALLAQPKFAIASTSSDGRAVGTGPYRIDKREPGRFSLTANDEYWGGRPYLDSVEM